MMETGFFSEGVSEFTEQVVLIKRVAKVTKGGKKFKISAWVVVGDGKGTVGIGHGKAAETPDAIRKATQNAYKNLVKVTIVNGTFPHEIIAKQDATKVLLKPAGQGTGIIASQPVRALLEVAGYENALTKIIGSTNPINAIKATLKGLLQMKDVQTVTKLRGIPTERLVRRFRGG